MKLPNVFIMSMAKIGTGRFMYEVTRHNKTVKGCPPCVTKTVYCVYDIANECHVEVMDENDNPTTELTKPQYLALINSVFKTTNFRGIP